MHENNSECNTMIEVHIITSSFKPVNVMANLKFVNSSKWSLFSYPITCILHILCVFFLKVIPWVIQLMTVSVVVSNIRCLIRQWWTCVDHTSRYRNCILLVRWHSVSTLTLDLALFSGYYLGNLESIVLVHIIFCLYTRWSTVEPLNNGHIGNRDLVLCWEIDPSRRLTRKPHPSILRLNLFKGVACGRLNQQFLCKHIQNQPRVEQNQQHERLTGFLGATW